MSGHIEVRDLSGRSEGVDAFALIFSIGHKISVPISAVLSDSIDASPSRHYHFLPLSLTHLILLDYTLGD